MLVLEGGRGRRWGGEGVNNIVVGCWWRKGEGVNKPRSKETGSPRRPNIVTLTCKHPHIDCDRQMKNRHQTRKHIYLPYIYTRTSYNKSYQARRPRVDQDVDRLPPAEVDRGEVRPQVGVQGLCVVGGGVTFIICPEQKPARQPISPSIHTHPHSSIHIHLPIHPHLQRLDRHRSALHVPGGIQFHLPFKNWCVCVYV